MMKPDFKTISLKELRDYLKINRTDNEAWDVFFDRIDRESTKSPLYPAPKSLEDFEKFLEDNPEIKARFGI
ncbi:MAG: DUF6887 family protein [Waterburya sp.]